MESTQPPTLSQADVDRFWSKVSGGSVAWCWIWTDEPNGDGYGRITIQGKSRGAHRIAYELLVSEIPHGLELDHLCRRRDCVNPWHMEPVTTAENIRRGRAGEAGGVRNAAKTHCPSGHAYTKANTYVQAKGSRVCVTCHRARKSRGGRAPTRLLSPGKLIAVRRWLDEGHTQAEVAQMLGVAQQTISKALAKEDI